MERERENRNKLGRWATLSSMAERYDRSTCSTELQLRPDILNAISDGWAPVKSFEIPKPPPKIIPDNDQNNYTALVQAMPSVITNFNLSGSMPSEVPHTKENAGRRRNQQLLVSL